MGNRNSFDARNEPIWSKKERKIRPPPKMYSAFCAAKAGAKCGFQSQ